MKIANNFFLPYQPKFIWPLNNQHIKSCNGPHFFCEHSIEKERGSKRERERGKKKKTWSHMKDEIKTCFFFFDNIHICCIMVHMYGYGIYIFVHFAYIHTSKKLLCYIFSLFAGIRIWLASRGPKYKEMKEV